MPIGFPVRRVPDFEGTVVKRVSLVLTLWHNSPESFMGEVLERRGMGGESPREQPVRLERVVQTRLVNFSVGQLQRSVSLFIILPEQSVIEYNSSRQLLSLLV